MSSSMYLKASVFILLYSFFLAPFFAASSENTHDGHKMHIVGVFLGATHFDVDDSETVSTYGFEYELRFHEHISVAVAYEDSPSAHHDDGVSVAVLGVFYRPDSHWRFGAAIGEERIGGDHPHTESLSRLAVSYDFHVGGFGIAPTFDIDFVDGNKAYVAGLVFSKAF